MKKLIFCHDGCLAPIIAKKSLNNWKLYGITEVSGMGAADYTNELFKFKFKEVIALNSFEGTAYVCLNNENKWGLLVVKDNQTASCNVKLEVNFIYDDMDKMLFDMKINKDDFFIDNK